MSIPMPLEVFSVFGGSLKDTIILAGHPDERFTPEGDIVTDSRTLMLRLHNQKAAYFDEFSIALNTSWRSHNGAVYCTAVNSNKLYIRWGEAWEEENFSPTPVEIVNSIFGISGKTPSQDQLFLTTNENWFFTRINGQWKRHIPPVGVTLLYTPYGTKANEIYVGGTCLFKWNGLQLEQLETPETDPLSALYITGDDRLIGGDNHLHISNDNGEWDAIETDYSDFMHIAEFKGALYAATFGSGVVRIFPGKPKAVTEPLEIEEIVNVGDGMIAFGEEEILMTDNGDTWQPIEMPECELNHKFR
ncbi:MAG: hypothetical protein MJB14_18515 [Spirochaetes bacterium]|nr:hypothetical protein [Spirochaetota bacterium]